MKHCDYENLLHGYVVEGAGPADTFRTMGDAVFIVLSMLPGFVIGVLTGLLRPRWWWTCLPLPVLAMAWAVDYEANAGPDYAEMGSGYYFAGLVAILTLAGWIVGRYGAYLIRGPGHH